MENPEPPKSLHCTPLVQVSLPEQLDELVEDLRKYSEFAIDVEHHSYRSFMGITCLIQISTVDTDYLVDTITLRDRLWVLNEVFTKPSIVKVRKTCLYPVNNCWCVAKSPSDLSVKSFSLLLFAAYKHHFGISLFIETSASTKDLFSEVIHTVKSLPVDSSWG